MGYTHYWHPKDVIAPDVWAKIVADAQKLIRASVVPLAWDYEDAAKPPQIDDDVIRFNGVGDDGCETFLFSRTATNGFDFCKTRQLPYDAVVVAVLSIASQYTDGAIGVASDGDFRDWDAGIQFAQAILGRDVPNPLLKLS